MQNKANFLLPRMNANPLPTNDYENENAFSLRKNKPNQTRFQTKPILTDRMKPKFFNSSKNGLTRYLKLLKYLLFCAELEFLMKSFMAKKEQRESKWLLVDADNAVLGRMAAKIAPMLMGKTKPTYTPHVDMGDYVVVINADKVRLTGKKARDKQYDYYTHHPGGHKFVSFSDMMAKKPEKVVELAVRRMLPKNKLGRKMLKKLKVYRGPEHEHHAQKPERVELF